MKCRYCGKQLNQNKRYCSHCGFDSNAKDLNSILREIARLKKNDILEDGQSLLNLLADIAPALRKERNLLSYLIKVNGNKAILDAGKRGESDLQEAIQRTAMQISDEYYVDQSKAKEICVTFASAAFPDSKLEKLVCQGTLKEEEIVCPYCGCINKADNVTCSKCGGKINGEVAENPDSEANTEPGGTRDTAPGEDNSTGSVKPGGISTNGQAKKRIPLWAKIAGILVLSVILFMSLHIRNLCSGYPPVVSPTPTHITVSQSTSTPEHISTIIAEGKCGDQCIWDLSQDGVLTVSGTGRMEDYDFDNNAPWHDYKETIHTVVVNQGITRIGKDAFWNCNRLTRVVLPESLEEIAGTAFSSCRVLPEFEISSNNRYFCVVAGVLFSKDMTKLICYPGGKSATKYDVPNSVTEIGEYAFHGSRIIELVLPELLQIIGSSAFADTEIISIRIPSGVKTIPIMAFYECRPLKTVYIPQSVTKIDMLAFSHTGLMDIFYEGSQLQWDAIKIEKYSEDNIPSSTKIHCNSW